MRSRINSTDRKKIDSGMAEFAVSSRDDGTASFEAQIDLSPLKLDPKAHVVVEAYRQSLHERFKFGTVDRPSAAEPTILRELGGDAIKFRIKVVEPNSGRVIARGDRFGAGSDTDAGRQELLRVVERDLGQEPWKTEIYDIDSKPVLVLNNQIPGAVGLFESDPKFRALILPAALRQVLMMLCIDRQTEEEADPDDEEGHWSTDWIRFAQNLAGREKPDWSETAEVMNWIDDVCAAFSRQHALLSSIPVED
jgi:hypothetical protein